MTEKLKPCKCGYKDVFFINTGSAKINRYAVVCLGCDLLFGYNLKTGGVFVSREQAIEAWNRRAECTGQE